MRSKILLTFLTFVSLASQVQGYMNPDPNHITIIDNGRVIEMTPNGFDTNQPSQDTINLQWVFDTFPNGDISLSAGTFHISTMIEAVNYQGKIEGAGKDSTFLVGRGPLVDGDYVFPELNQDFKTRLYPSGVPHLIWFHPSQGAANDWVTNKVDLEIKDLTIRLDGVGPAITYFGVPVRSIWSLLIITGSNAVITEASGNVSHVDLELKDVNLQAQEVSYTLNGNNLSNPNAAAGVLLYGGENWVPSIGLNGYTEIDHGPVNAVVDIRDCTFDLFHQFAIGVEATYTTNPGTGYTFPDNPVFPPSAVSIRDNTFNGVGSSLGIPGSFGFNTLVLSPSETTITIKDNILNDVVSSGIGFLRGVAITIPELTSFATIKDNTINMVANPLNGAGIRLFDFSFFAGTPLIVYAQDNILTGGTGYNKPLIEHAMGTAATFDDNKFFGEAQSGISAGNTISPLPPTIPLPVVQDTIFDNDFGNLTSSIANIILGPASSYNTVTVENASDVLNQGVGNTVIVE